MTVVAPIVGVAILASVLISSLGILQNQPQGSQAQASSQNICKTDVSQLKATFPIKQPSASALPIGYKLQAVEEMQDVVVLYYTDHPVCPDLSIGAQEAQGTIVVLIGPVPFGNSSKEIQKQQLEMYNSTSNKDIVAKIQALDVNGFAAVGWEPYVGQAPTYINGTLAHTEPASMPGKVAWFNDNDKIGYSVWGNQPLTKLLEIARSIPK